MTEEAAPPNKAYRIKCEYACQWATQTVVVEARSVGEACARAMELANDRVDEWNYQVFEGDTFVSEVVDISPGRKRRPIPIPLEFREHEKRDALATNVVGVGIETVERLQINDEHGEEAPYILRLMDLVDEAAEVLGWPAPYGPQGAHAGERREAEAIIGKNMEKVRACAGRG